MSIYTLRTDDELGLDYGGVWEQTARETTWRRTISSFSTRNSFSQVSCLFLVNAPHAWMRDDDQAELLSRRLEQYEETLRVMYQGITESLPDQGALRCNIEQLLNALRRILERLESLYCDNNEDNDYEDITRGSSDGISSQHILDLWGGRALRYPSNRFKH